MKTVEPIVLIICAALLINSIDPFNWLMFIAPLLMIIIFYLIIPSRNKTNSINTYKSNLKYFQKLTYCINDEHLKVTYPHGESIYEWSNFKEIIEIDDLIVLVQKSEHDFLIPRRSFGSEYRMIEICTFIYKRIDE